jgi:hypothetical protein
MLGELGAMDQKNFAIQYALSQIKMNPNDTSLIDYLERYLYD